MNIAIKRVKNGFAIDKADQYGRWETDEVWPSLGQAIESVAVKFCTIRDEETGEEKVDEQALQGAFQCLIYALSNRSEQKTNETKEEE